MNSELLPQSLCANLYTSTFFPVCGANPQLFSSRPYGLNASGSIEAENPSLPATRSSAECHLLWTKIATPFISVFNRYSNALDKAQRLEEEGYTDIHIIVIDTYTVPQGQLSSAHRIATELRFPANRLRYHVHEYLFYGSIERERILAVLPAKGPRISTPVHLGTLTLPQACFEMIGSRDIDAVKAYLRGEIQRRWGWRDEVALQQMVSALCTDRWD